MDGASWRTGRLRSFDDARGSLVPFDLDGFGMSVRRFFWIHDVPPGATRAGHGHTESLEVLVVLTGSVTVDIDSPAGDRHVATLARSEWLFVPTHHVIVLRDFAPGTIVGVLATGSYDPDEFLPLSGGERWSGQPGE